MSSEVQLWWTAMTIVAVVNVALLALSARAVLTRVETDSEVARYRRLQLLLSSGFVLGCASRSIVLRADVQRFCMIDSWIGCPLVGRSVATVAELSFVIQWALLLGFFARRLAVPHALALSRVLVPIIVVAETCSWYAVLTTNYLGNALEESLWTLTAALAVLGVLTLYRSADAPWLRRLLVGATCLGLAYVVFMCTVDVPMYFSRWRADEAAGRAYLSLGAGLGDAMTWVVTRRWEDWRDEVAWMSLYFSVAVWLSLALVHLPLPEPRTPPK